MAVWAMKRRPGGRRRFSGVSRRTKPRNPLRSGGAGRSRKRTKSARRPTNTKASSDLASPRREYTLFRRFKADEASQSITERRRRQKPEDNNERQAIHGPESAGHGEVR